MRRQIGSSKLKELILEVYRGEIKEGNAGFLVRCPWHDDHNPSCVVFYKSAIFYCLVCHGDKKKGERGKSPYTGFRALGMAESRARSLFLSPASPSLDLDDLTFNRLPSFDVDKEEPLSLSTITSIKNDKVVSRAPWPLTWGFRDLDADFMASSLFKKRFEPTKVMLKNERFPRLALSIGGAEKYKDTQAPNYLHHEVYLRLASSVQPKSVNSYKLNLDIETRVPTAASLFGLVNNRIPNKCRGVFLVEGPYDGMRLLSHTHTPEVGGNFAVVSILGTPQWANCLNQIKSFLEPTMIKRQIPFILAFDNDEAGAKLTATAIRDLQSLYFPKSLIKILAYPLSVKDPGELAFDLFLQCLRKLGF